MSVLLFIMNTDVNNWTKLFSFVSAEYNSLNSLVSEAFIRFFLETIGHYSLFIAQNERGERVFQREAFRKSVASKSIRRFLGVFMESQMFAGFIQDRELRKTRAKGRLSFPECQLFPWLSSFLLKNVDGKSAHFSLWTSTPVLAIILTVQEEALQKYWSLVAESYHQHVFTPHHWARGACNFLEYWDVSYFPFSVFCNLFCCPVDRSVWAEGGSVSGGASGHRAEWSQQVSERAWWVLQQTQINILKNYIRLHDTL